MTKEFGTRGTTGGIAGFRIAYSLNNRQPVRCTIISDQPLFYMDYEGCEDEDAAGSPFGMADMERDIAAVRRQAGALEECCFGEGSEVFMAFLDDAASAVLPVCPADREQDLAENDIAVLEKTLRRSRMAAAYLDFAARHGSALAYGPETASAFYDRRSGTIFINPDQDTGTQLLLAARELRRLWQHRNGALLHPLTFHPDQAILVNRAQVADLATAMVRVAWDLQLAEERSAWDRLENSSLADLAHAFAREAYLDFRTLNNGTAAAAVFEAWFLSERCRHEDRGLIQLMLADYQGYVFENPEASRSVGADLLAALGTMPVGKNYLAPHAPAIVGEAVFTEVRDRSNANFLWFIKFERSFREAEQELQGQEANVHGTRPGTASDNETNDKKRPGNYGTEKIVALPSGRAGSGIFRKKKSGSKGNGDGNVVAFRRSGREP